MSGEKLRMTDKNKLILLHWINLWASALVTGVLLF